MTEARAFEFNTGSVATAYDEVLVPVMFEPWGHSLIEAHGPWTGQRALDLATGPGVLARLLVDAVGPEGAVVAADINPEMLARAHQRCGDVASRVELVESPAAPLAVDEGAFDTVVCQQGFQFFPDRVAACREVARVLRPGGRAIASVWKPAVECQMFGEAIAALREVDEPEIAEMLRAPFDFLAGDELLASFEQAGFEACQVETVASDLVVPGGVPGGVEMLFATPIRPRLVALSTTKQEAFRQAMTRRLERLTPDGVTMGQLAAAVVTGRKPVSA